MKKHVCSIYVLMDSTGNVFYVGRTHRAIKSRIGEHKSGWLCGREFTYKIIARSSKRCREVERKWIKHFLRLGKLENIGFASDGLHFHSEETRRKLAQLSTGRPVYKWANKISAAQKGIEKCWSARGLVKQKKTRFKKGENNWSRLSKVAQDKMREAARKSWRDPELRKRMSAGWSKALSPEVRARAGKSISRALTGKQWSECQRRALTTPELRKKRAKRMSKVISKWWAGLSPKEKQEQIEIRRRTFLKHWAA